MRHRLSWRAFACEARWIWVLASSVGGLTDDNGGARLCPAEASALVMQEVSVDSSLHLAGLRLHGREERYAKGDMLLRGVRLGGGLRFWSTDIAANLRRQCAAAARRA